MIMVPVCKFQWYNSCCYTVHVSTWWATYLLFDTCVLACIGSIYLAYILAFVLHDLCIVCVATYVVNFYLFYASYHRYQHAWFTALYSVRAMYTLENCELIIARQRNVGAAQNKCWLEARPTRNSPRFCLFFSDELVSRVRNCFWS